MTIDVMLPFYGNMPQFMEAVRSVLAQDAPDWRLVCVDDASPHGDADAWLTGLNDPRVVSLRNPENLGVARNFNHCLALVEAPYFVMMGGDDVMRENYVSTVAAIAQQHPEADVIQPGVEVIDGEGAPARPLADRVKRLVRPSIPPGSTLTLSGPAMAETLTRADWAYFPSILWRTTTAQRIGFDERWDVALDLGLLLEIALADGTMVASDSVCFDYRRHDASFSSTTASDGLRFAQERDFFELYATRFEERGWKRAARIARTRTVSRLNALHEAALAAAHGNWRASGGLAKIAFS